MTLTAAICEFEDFRTYTRQLVTDILDGDPMIGAEQDEPDVGPCPTCDGSGEVGIWHPPTFNGPGEWTDLHDCPDCQGTGMAG